MEVSLESCGLILRAGDGQRRKSRFLPFRLSGDEGHLEGPGALLGHPHVQLQSPPSVGGRGWGVSEDRIESGHILSIAPAAHAP